MATYANCEIQRKRILALNRKIQVRLIKNPFMGKDADLNTDRGGDGNGDWPSDKTTTNQYMLQVKCPPGGTQMGVGALNSPTVHQLLGTDANKGFDAHNGAVNRQTANGSKETIAFRMAPGGVSGFPQGGAYGAVDPDATSNKGRLGGTRTGQWITVHADHASNTYEDGLLYSVIQKLA